MTKIDVDPDHHEGTKEQAEDELTRLRERIATLQERLYAERKHALLVVLQAMDTGGKDGAIEKVFGGINPMGIVVTSYKAPTAEELAHDFLWRLHARTPALGHIGIWNRSHYEDVLVVRVHQLVPKAVWEDRYQRINDFEANLAAAGTTILKFFLHISKAEQKQRLEARLADPTKQWKFNVGDLAERERWDDYQAAYADAIRHCSTKKAPWTVVPANRKWYRNLVVARAVVRALEQINPQFPPVEGLTGVTVPD